MIEPGAACGGVDDTIREELEDERVSFNANRDRASRNGYLEISGVVRFDICATRWLYHDLAAIVLATLINSDIGVVSSSI
jgi:hypothetical protein